MKYGHESFNKYKWQHLAIENRLERNGELGLLGNFDKDESEILSLRHI